MTIKYIHDVYKTDRHDISEILLKVALNNITLTLTLLINYNIILPFILKLKT